jgi:hypothetical protein
MDKEEKNDPTLALSDSKEDGIIQMDKVNKKDPTLVLSDSKGETMIKIKHRKKLSKIKFLILEWSQSVTYHCFPKIFKEKTRSCMRFIWAFIFLVFSSFTCYILVNNIISYYEYNVVSTIRVINEESSVFPAVTICNSNPYLTKYAENLTKYLAKEHYGIELENSTLEEFKLFIPKLEFYMKIYVNDPEYSDTNRKRLGVDFATIINSCYFNSEPCNSTRDFQWFFHPTYGNCIQYNANSFDLKSSTLPGKSYGLELSIGPLKSENKYPIKTSTGLKVLINNQSFTPHIDDSFISIEPGKETDIAVDRTFTSNMPKPYSSCTDLTKGFNSELYNFITKSNRTYRQIDCIDLCLQRYIQNRCNCFYTPFPKMYPASPCLNLTQIDCFRKSYSDIINCDIDCPLECDSVTYNLQLSSLTYPSLEYGSLFANDTTPEEYFSDSYSVNFSSYALLREYFYSINIYYSSLKYTYLSESPQTTVFGLLSSLGGSLGMFLGLSVFSLLEVFEILFELIWNLICFKF